MAGSSLKEMIKAGAKIIDVRSAAEFEDESYPGAVNIPLHLIPAKLDEFGPKDGAIVLYCASGARSAMAARLLKQEGYSNVVNAGGIDDMPR
jgi:phage shock protein E